MFERMSHFPRPSIQTHFELVRQERSVIGPHIASLPIVRESIIGTSHDRASVEQLRDSLLLHAGPGAIRDCVESWIAALPVDRVVNYDIRAKRDIKFGGG